MGPMDHSPLQRAIDAAGGTQAALADALKASASKPKEEITQQAVSYWLRNDRVPPHWVPAVSEVTGIPRHELRPDMPSLFPPPAEAA